MINFLPNNSSTVTNFISILFIFNKIYPMFYATKPMSYSKFLEFFRVAGNPVYGKKDKNEKNKSSFTDQPVSKKDSRQYLVVTPVEQFMISTGKRMFKGYNDYDECLRLIFDLESTGLNTKTDRIEEFGIRFNRPVKYKGQYITFERTYRVEGETEEERKESESGDSMITDLSYKIKLPVKAGENNASKVSEDGKELTWNLKYSKLNEVNFAFALGNNLLPIIIAVVAGVLILMAVTGKFKKKPKEAEETDAVEETEETEIIEESHLIEENS
jgi:hypothetical protein